ncbi:hypothetical protein AUEXF2481DRAFT_2008 [Aureobasidium subglaciale EXF-2481]|uniref:Cohesin loading factor n=1 Tax=Aureobasidium subglaciale (strain EXF-2481) TaxID=1043005 RepID=A0A074ZLC2_AURSE|nr:uncharacterized protein AUEXF2481DRAFT_2008 [Aureobasidium subglaciale EXF-2481]KEQ99201.1 hypothetical protein AUEXF2481DRAFT_2008 [Aureobasidium subglaciale EXF-2481]
MYGYQQSPAGNGYQPHPMNMMLQSSGPGQGYSMQSQYPMNGQPGRPQTHAYVPSHGASVMGQVMQQPQYAMPHAQYQPQPLSYQSHQQNPQSMSQILVNQQHQPRQRPSQQYMQPQPVQAYQMDGAPGYSPPRMRPPQTHQGQNVPSSQQRPRQPSNSDYAPVENAPQVRSMSNAPSRQQHQSQQQSREQHASSSSQSHPLPMPSPTPAQGMTPRQPQPQPQARATPQAHKHAMSPPQPRPRQPSSSQSQIVSQPRPASQMRTPQVVIEPRRPSSQNPATPVPSRTPVLSTPIPSKTPVPNLKESAIDLQPVLLGLADQYISRAHGMSSYLARNPQEADVDQYYSLISAGLGCLESVLKNWKFSEPKIEARLQLRYANLLLEETENDGELQDLLTRGIALCERNRLVDLKYSMKHVQARSLFRTHPRSAFKMMDQMIELTETYAHYPWMYVYRFLKVSFSLQMSRPDLNAALQQLRRISQLAEKQRQHPILATCSALEALVHLRSDQADSADNFQRSLAAARTHQLNRDVADISQIAALLDCLDLCSDLMNGKPEQLMEKMNVMQKALDGGKRKTAHDGSFYVPTTENAPEDVSLDTCGIMERTTEGKRAIVFQWLRRSEVFALGYIFSSLASVSKNIVDHKAEKYVIEGGKLTQNDYNPENERKVQSLQCTSAQLDRRMFYHKVCLQLLASFRCERADWKGAQEVLEQLTEGLKPESVDDQDFVQVSSLYMTGLVKQATGDLEGALQCYKSPALALQAGQKTSTNQDLRILSTLNMILILRPRRELREQVNHLMDIVEPLCLKHANENYKVALYIVRASSTSALPILKMKNYLSMSASIAKKQQNIQMLCMAINLMTTNFFENIMGEKAEMSAGAGKKLADRTQSPLWQAVSSQMLSNTYSFGGKRAEAVEAGAEAQKWMQVLPESVQDKFEVKR